MNVLTIAGTGTNFSLRLKFARAAGVSTQMKFELLTGKRALGTAYSRDYTEWAESLLYEDVDSENVAILASMGCERDPDSEEIEKYFLKSIRDLDLTLPSEKDGLRRYAKALCEQIVSGDLEPEKGVSILETFYSRSDYEAIYSIWDELSEDLWMVSDRDGCIFNTGLSTENKNEYIKGVAAQFIELLEMQLPERFFQLSACPACGHIGESESEVIDKPWLPDKLFRLIYNRGQTQRAICSRCKRPFPNNMSDYEGRKQYLSSKC
ncbi:hypothetical protein [Halopseudomonas salegens]|uniref:Uncharacterized protein n=1 Tax=Halopseudomonas salegens TaxID=1434072 RepID=A0A1H2GQ70_9GAMM|nr:hypothetical protein [Halopseudomonas salegens]SDU21599.1 hypothetical protein SAMN05216210_2462 [Halopseudomonas salegens]